MKKITLLLALCGVCGLLHSQGAGTFTIDARIKGLEKGDTIYIMHQGEDRDIDTIVCNKKNRISYSKPIDKMHPAVLFEIPQGGTINDVKDDKILPLCTGDYTLSLKGEKGYLENITISGGVYDNHRDYFDTLRKYAAERAPIRKRLDSLMKEKNIPLVLRAEHNALTRRTNDSVWAVVRKEREALSHYISPHTDDPFSAYVLLYNNVKNTKELYYSLSDEVKNTPLAHIIKKQLDINDAFDDGKKNLKVGIPFTDFSLLSHTGDTIRLSSYKGKYVLLDFWGSWCGPCIKEIPHIKEIWKRYGTREDFALIGMALETDEKQWHKAIDEHSMEWTHVNINSEKDRKKAVNVIHGIYMYPSLILLDKEGHVIAIQLGGGEQNSVIDRKLEEVLK